MVLRIRDCAGNEDGLMDNVFLLSLLSLLSLSMVEVGDVVESVRVVMTPVPGVKGDETC